MMFQQRPPRHVRKIAGIRSREVAGWRDIPLNALYFVEHTLPGGAGRDPRRGPALLLPGSWDPIQGEYSDNLIRSLLFETGAPAVLEAHYRHGGQHGYVAPAALVEDLAAIYLDPDSPPTVVGLCFACPFVLEALLVARERCPAPPVAGVLVIGYGLPGFLNTVGRTALWSHINMKVGAEARHCSYTGHTHVAGNNARGVAWTRGSRLLAAMEQAAKETSQTPFPVTVDSLYFRLDISTRQARALTRQLFGIDGERDAIPGYHRSLRRRSPADQMIAAFYERTQTAAAASHSGAAATRARRTGRPDT